MLVVINADPRLDLKPAHEDAQRLAPHRLLARKRRYLGR
jgi:hypothetical protein